MKKIISLTVILCIVLSSLGAFAYDIPLDYNIYEDDLFRFDVGEFVTGGEGGGATLDKDIEILSLLGIWDDAEKDSNALVTRTEFSVIMSNLKLGAGNAFGSVYTQEENVDEEKATYKAAYSYLIEMLGYTHLIKEFGGGEQALLVAVSKIGLLADNSKSLDSFITRAELAKLIMKAVSIDLCIMEQTATGGYKYSVTEGKNLLTAHSIYDVSGFVNAVYGLSVYGGLYLREGEFEVDRKVIKTGETDVSEYFSTRVTAFARYDEDVNVYNLIYIAPDEKCESVEIDFRDIIDIKGNDIEYTDKEGNEQYLSVDGFANIVENGKKLNSISEMSDYAENEGEIIITSSNTHGDYDTAVIYKYDYFVVKYVDTLLSQIGLEFGMKYNGLSYIPIDPHKINKISLDGEAVEFTKLPVNAVIRVMECAHKGYIEIVGNIGKKSGVIESIYEDIVNVDGTGYRVSQNMRNRIKECEEDTELSYNDKMRIPSIGANVTAFVFDDILVGCKEGSKYKYAYLKSVGLSRTSIDPEISLRLFTENSEWVDLSLKDRITLDGVEGVSKDRVREFITANKDAVVGELVRYAANKEDQIIFLDTIIESQNELDTTDDLAFADGHENGVHNWTCDWTRTDIKDSVYKFEAGIPVFAIPAEASEEEKYKVVSVNSFTEKEQYEIVLYSPDEFFHLPVILYRGDMSVNVDEGTYSHLYIEKISKSIIDEYGNIGYKLTGKQFVDGRVRGVGSLVQASFYVTEKQYDEGKFVIGDLIRIYVTKDRIDKYLFEEGFERGSGEITATTGVYTLDYNSVSGVNNYLYVGRIKKIDLERMLVLIDCGEGGVHVKIPRVKCIIDPDAKKATGINLADFHEEDYVIVFNIGDTIHTRFVAKTTKAR